jgi:hypothetical protein
MVGAFSRTHAIFKICVGFRTNAVTYDGYGKHKKTAFTKDKCFLQKSEMYCVNQLAQPKWILDVVFVQMYPAGCFPDGSVIESFIKFVGCQKLYRIQGFRICIFSLSRPLLASLRSIKFNTEYGMTEGKKSFILGPHLHFSSYWDKKESEKESCEVWYETCGLYFVLFASYFHC